MATVSANKLELLQIADAVAREKAIDRKIVLGAMEDAIAKAARSRYGSETDVHAEIDPKSGELHLSRHMQVVDAVENPASQITLDSCNRRTCTTTRTVTVSASDTPTGPISTTTSRSTTKSGGCTTRTTTTDTFADLAGTMTIDGTSFDQTGSIDVFTSTSTTHCK